MKPVAVCSLVILASFLAAAQTSNGRWRRVDEPPPVTSPGPAVPAPAAQVAQPAADGQDPTLPVDRSDQFGQSDTADRANPQAAQPNARPQAVQAPPAQPPAAQNEGPYYGVPQQLTLKAGTYITVRINQGLNSDRNRAGDVFSATLVQPVVVDGVVVAQRGQSVYGRVTLARKAGRVEGISNLGLDLTGMTLVDGTQEQIHSAVVVRNGRTDTGRDVGAVATTTAVGAAVGAAADWGRGAAIGAGAGAAAGLIGVLLTRGHPTVVYPESVLTFQTTQPVTISTVRAPQAFRYVDPNEYDRGLVAAAPQPRPRPRPAPYYGAYPPPYYGPYYYPAYGPYYGGVGVGIVIHSRPRWRRW
jgi:hypothetical protein